MVHSKARGCDVTIGYRGVWDREKVRSTKQQIERDASRKPLTPDEQVVYNRGISREWRSAASATPLAVLERLVDKGWLNKTWVPGHQRKDDCWFYQRTHSLDEETRV